MIVFAGNARCAYSVKRAKRRAVAGIVFLILVACAFGAASKHDEEDSRALAAEFSHSHRNTIVTSWKYPEREQVAAKK